MQFSSPIGESTFSTREPTKQQKENKLFSSPIGESTFSTAKEISKITGYAVFVPYRGIYFLYNLKPEEVQGIKVQFSSPIGESTFSTYKVKLYIGGHLFSSPIGESTFSTFRGHHGECA